MENDRCLPVQGEVQAVEGDDGDSDFGVLDLRAKLSAPGITLHSSAAHELSPLRIPIRNPTPKQIHNPDRQRFRERQHQGRDGQEDSSTDNPGSTTVFGEGGVGDGADEGLGDEAGD